MLVAADHGKNTHKSESILECEVSTFSWRVPERIQGNDQYTFRIHKLRSMVSAYF